MKEEFSTKEQVKPCPFCGFSPFVTEGWLYDEPESTQIVCHGQVCFVRPRLTAPSLQKAIDRWNYRAGEEK